MKKSILLIIFVSFSTVLLGQVYEIGVFIGGSNYVGDIGRTNYIYPNKVAGAAFFKYNLNPKMALRATYSYIPITGDDKDADTDYRRTRGPNNIGYNFSNTINELALGLEYNFYEYDLSSKDKTSTPYILFQIAAVDYETPRIQNPDRTFNFTRNTAVSIPLGIGYKTKIIEKIAFAVETTVRYTFTDELDYSTSRFSQLNFGGTSNDWYLFSGVSLVYTFGRPACFSD